MGRSSQPLIFSFVGSRLLFRLGLFWSRLNLGRVPSTLLLGADCPLGNGVRRELKLSALGVLVVVSVLIRILHYLLDNFLGGLGLVFLSTLGFCARLSRQ